MKAYSRLRVVAYKNLSPKEIHKLQRQLKAERSLYAARAMEIQSYGYAKSSYVSSLRATQKAAEKVIVGLIKVLTDNEASTEGID